MELQEKEMEKVLDTDMENDIVTCEVPFGGMVLLNNCIPHRSLENYSDKIRWSLDLRWQDPKNPTGFYDLKESVVMKKADDPNYQIDWTGENKKQLLHYSPPSPSPSPSPSPPSLSFPLTLA